MKIHTFSIVAGSEACNASCPFCVSKMTVANGVPEGRAPEINIRRFQKACRLAQLNGVTTAMITGKGEPTLFPNQVSEYLTLIQPYEFPLIEMQTNGIPIITKMTSPNQQVRESMKSYLLSWLEMGLTTIAISMCGIDPELNRKIYLPHAKEYIDLPMLIKIVHEFGFSARLAGVMIAGGIDSPEKVQELVAFGREHKVEQITIRPVNKPGDDFSHDSETSKWASGNGLTHEQKAKVKQFLNEKGTRLMELVHGGTVYDLDGQNICLTNCLTIDPDKDELRQLIFFPDGHIRYDWVHEGAILV
jgi:molybdenum cofactor biosynthesis enzyme MoaA